MSPRKKGRKDKDKETSEKSAGTAPQPESAGSADGEASMEILSSAMPGDEVGTDASVPLEEATSASEAGELPAPGPAVEEITLDDMHRIAPVTDEGDSTQVLEAVESPPASGCAGSAGGAEGAVARAAAESRAGPEPAVPPATVLMEGSARLADPVPVAEPAMAADGVMAADAAVAAVPVEPSGTAAAEPPVSMAEPEDGPPRLAELIEKMGRGPRVGVPGERAEAVRLALAVWLGRDLDAAPTEVDGRGLPPGLAPEAANQLGRVDAPLGMLVLVTAAQRELPIWDPLHSFEETLRDSVFRRLGATLELLLERQILVGEILARPAAPATADELIALENVAVRLDTPGRHLASVSRFEESLARVAAQPDLLLDEERIDGLVARAQEMSAALGDAAGGGLAGPLEVTLELGSFWTASFGGVYRLAARPPILVRGGPREGRAEGGDVVRLTEPGLIDRLHASGFLSYDIGLIEQRTRELEEWALLGAGIDPGAMDEAARRRTVAGRARQMPRTWHELITVRRATQGGPSGARVIHTLSAETKVKLSRPLRDTPVVTRLLAELDAIDVPRQFAAAPDRFARDYLAASPLVRRHMARLVLGAACEAPPPSREPEPPPPEEGEDEEIQFL